MSYLFDQKEKGNKICIAMAAYVVAKAVLNMILAKHFVLLTLVIALAEAALFFARFKYVNYVLAAVLALIAIVYLPQNIANIGSNWIYLLEGVIDLGCAALLCFNRDVKSVFYRSVNY